MPASDPDALAELRTTLRRFLREQAGSAQLREAMATPQGYASGLWRRLANELGLPGLIIPERFGGAGATMVELCVVLQEMGMALLCAPYLSSAVLAPYALIGSGDEAAMAEYLPGVAAGRTIATVALTGESGIWAPDGLSARAVEDADGWRLQGFHTFVLDGMLADLVLAAAGTTAGVSLFAASPHDEGASRRELPTVDLTRRQARLEWSGTPARLIGGLGAAAPGIAHLLDLAAVALAAESTGVAQRALDETIAYVRTRHQFGQPIGAFQAVKHRCADMLASVEAARSCVNLAAAAAAAATPDLPALASMAKAWCGDAALHVTGENIQLHGAIGFTWEHDAHLWFKRAATSRLLFGDPASHRERLVAELGI